MCEAVSFIVKQPLSALTQFSRPRRCLLPSISQVLCKLLNEFKSVQ